ncbi:hypothetical protein H8A95_19915 [Bradyrhizobium sp. Pear76]|uniref:hypothetical protein n=1 Tax=Bradyrhizobium oropedii TaxID=1571201 RepID=UPI001E65501A|nr:hypothetical protein [Bradyrhizobium oropedii]MCC8964520.1 hypothetical protein [Bradyrhizobium oropedii]
MAENYALPSFDDMPDSQQAPAPERPLMFDDLPDWPGKEWDNQFPRVDDAPTNTPAPTFEGQDFDQLQAKYAGQDFDELARQYGGQPQAESEMKTFGREAAHGVLPAAGGILAGAGTGFLAGTVWPGIGNLVGAVAGGIAGAYGTSKAQEAGLKALGYDDSQQRAANAEANPKSSMAGEMAPALATMRPDRAATALQRGVSAGLMGGINAGQQYATTGKVNPGEVAAQAVAGAALPSFNRFGQRLEATGQRLAGKVAGRPNVDLNPAAQPAQDEAQASQQPVVEGEAATVQTAPPETGDTVGNPQSSPERSDRVYGKDTAPSEQDDMLTTGDMDPATAAALLDQFEGKPARQSAPQPVQEPDQPQVVSPPQQAEGVRLPSFDEMPGEHGPTPPAAMPARANDGDKVQGEVGAEGLSDHTQTDQPEGASKSPTLRGLMDKLVNDEGGWVDHGKIVDDLKSKLKGSAFLHSFLEPGRKPTKSYIARGVHDNNLSPQEEYARSLSDELYKVRKAKEQHVIDLQKWAASLPKELNNPKTLERMYFAREAGKINQLDPHEQALYNQHLKPLFDENDRLFDQVSKLDPDMLGPKIRDHIYRIGKGDSPERNILNPGESTDPIEGTYALATRPRGTMLDRKFVALESPEGRRYVISLNHDGFTLWNNGQPMKVVDPGFEYKNGENYQLGHRDFTMKEATTPEIEEHARLAGGGKPEYYHNAALSASAANLDLGEIARHLQFLQDLKSNPEFLKHAKKPGEKTPDNYVETRLQNFKGWRMDPQLAYVMDDFARPGINEPAINRLRQLSQAVTKTIFWMPTAHIRNVGEHWFVERGFRWLPGTGGYKSLALDGLKAIKSVVTQDELQKQLRESGAGTIYGGVISRNALDNLAKGFGEAVKTNPSKWDPIARQFGVGPSDLVKAVYKASSHAMWAANDMFLTHSVLEHMRDGMSMQDAITKAERHIPNYRIPTTIMGSKQGARIFSQILAEPTFMVFGRYHYGVFNSYANIAKDLVRGSRGNKLDAIGNLFAMGLLSFAVYPVLDKAARWITGNDHASAARRGPLAIPYHLHEAARGKENLTTAARDTFTLSPALSTAMQQLSGLDWRGKPIIEPGDVAKAAHGDWRGAARAVAQEADFLGRGLVSPYSTMTNVINKKQSFAGGLRDQALDVRNPSQGAIRYEQQLPRKLQESAVSRQRHPVGLAERLANKVTKP